MVVVVGQPELPELDVDELPHSAFELIGGSTPQPVLDDRAPESSPPPSRPMTFENESSKFD